MKRSLWMLAAASAFGIPSAGLAQADPPKSEKPVTPARLSGKTAVDLVRLEPGNPSIPLRNAGVIPDSETLELDGRTLRKGTDYSIDYPTGMVYLMVRTRDGQALRAAYRHDPSRAVDPSKSSNNLALHGLTYDFKGGSKVMVGLGLAERGKDGSITTSNLYGLKNQFSLAPGMNVSGVFAMASRKKIRSSSLLEHSEDDKKVDETESNAIVQSLEYNVGGGKISAGYQDIGTKFSGFQAFSSAGFSDKRVNELSKEKGLKRNGFAVENISIGGMQISAGQRHVNDKEDGVDWRNYGIKAGGMKLDYQRQQVDKGFKRFKDLSEGDRDQLAKEADLVRESLGGGFAAKGFMTNFQSIQVEDKERNGVYRKLLDVNIGSASLKLSRQNVDKDFNRFEGLRDADRGQLAREKGLSRESLAFNYKPFGANGLNMVYSASNVVATSEEDKPEFQSQDIQLTSKNVNYTRLLRGSDKAFSGLGSLSDGEIGDHIKAVTMMYEPEAFATKGEEKFGFIGGAGITRQLDRLQWQPKTGVNFRVDNLQFGGVNGKGHARRAELTSKSITVKHASQQFGSDFDEAGALMEFERNRLGALSGLGRDETVINAQFGPTTLNAGTVKMSRQGEGEATRSGMSLQTKGLEFSANQRNVDQTFETVGQVADPERDLLANIRGFKQSDYSLKFDMVKGLRMALRGVDALNSTTGERRDIKEQIVAWQPDSLTSLNYYRLENKIAGESELLNLNSVERWEFSRQIAKLGSVAFSRESIDYDGSQVDTPDSDRSTFAVSANVGDKTSVSTERTNIKYSDGGSEQIQTHAINKEITNKVGVSVSQTDVKRDGEKADESKRNYGLWYDFGKGLRVQYGFARQINSTASGAMQSNFSMTPGEVGGIKVDSLNYTDQRWDGSRYQSTGNVQLGTTKPLDLGLFKKFTFNYGVDTFRDYQKFQRENRNISAAGLVFGNQFGYEYRSQVAQSSERAIDRLFKFSTGKNDKAPLRATVSYKLRTMPGDKTFAIRNYDLYARPSKNFQITHTLQTNPEVARGDMLLGTQVQSARISKWRLDFIGNESTKFGIAWDETRNDQNKSVSRTGGVNLKLFAKNASPLELFYGLEHNESPDKKRTAHRYHLRFDQQPGPNQMFSIFLGNVNWQNSRDKSFKVQNWASRVEYQLRF